MQQVILLAGFFLSFASSRSVVAAAIEKSAGVSQPSREALTKLLIIIVVTRGSSALEVNASMHRAPRAAGRVSSNSCYSRATAKQKHTDTQAASVQLPSEQRQPNKWLITRHVPPLS